jgi:3-vinyl bacteriochlorophyllide hydratase
MPRYTPEQLAKRNASVWTDNQVILAPLQFFIFLGGVTLNMLFCFMGFLIQKRHAKKIRGKQS